jgi:general L-amino acid transport system substrate-binding protein
VKRSLPDWQKGYFAVIKKNMRAVAKLALLVAIVLPAYSAHAGNVLDGIKARGWLRCGVSEGIPGFSDRDPAGGWQGLDADFCRAVAAATLGDPSRVKFVPLKSTSRFPALAANQIDLLLRNTTWTLAREALLGVQFPGVLFYDGQGFMVPRAAHVKAPADLNGATICTEKGTTSDRHLGEYFAALGWKFKPLVIDSAQGAADALFSGRCQAYTADASQLAAMRTRAPGGPQDFIVLPERISREPLSPVVPGGDGEWATVVRWVLVALIKAEEQGVTRANVDTRFKQGAALFGGAQDEQVARRLGVRRDWALRAIGAVGNYGEIYERNFGPASPVPLERGLNRLWTDGGLHYALPFN